MICTPGVEARFPGGAFPFDPSSDVVFEYAPETICGYPSQGFCTPLPNPDPVVRCYQDAAKASALQMIKERNARRKAAGLPALLPGIGANIPQMFGAHCERNGLSDGCAGLYNSEWYWYNGGMAFVVKIAEDSADSAPVGFMDIRPIGEDQYWQTRPNYHYIPVYEGDFRLSLRQMILDDLAEQNGLVMQALQAPDGITTYAPDRLAEAQLAETYARLRAQEEAALQIVAQTQTPGTVAEISTTQTVTDPVGRLILGQITQQATSQIPHTGTGQEVAPGQGVQPPAGTTAAVAQQLQSGPVAAEVTRLDSQDRLLTSAATTSAAGSGFGTILLGGIAVAAMTLFGKAKT